MLATCDNSMNCGTLWQRSAKQSGPNFHSTETALELLNAYTTSLKGLGNETFSAPVADKDDKNRNSDDSRMNISSFFILTWVLLMFLIY